MDMARDLPLLGGLGLAIVAAVFLAAAETALLRLPIVRARTLAETGRRGARLLHLIERLPTVLNTVLLAALLAQITAATITGILAERWFGNLGVTIASVILTVVLFIYGEAIPKTYTVRHTDRVGLWIAVPVTMLVAILRPIVALLVWIADIQIPGQGITTSPTVTEDELRHLATRAAREGEITSDDHELIERAFKFGDRQVDDVMVPRLDIIAVEADLEVRAALASALEHGHRRLPVYDGTIENIIGVVRLRDLVKHVEKETLVRELVEPILVVPESKPILALLQEMQSETKHVAIVVDEYGGTAGLVTIDDIVEELLGSVADDTDDAPIRETIMGWSIDGSLPVEDLEELIGEIPDGDWNTAGGLVMGLVGRVPAIGDEVELAGGRLRVEAIRGRRIIRLDVITG
jgi:CBS domain containing-hemolysin-like protein